MDKWIIALYSYTLERTAIAQSVQRLATGRTVRGSNPGGGARFSAPIQTDSGGPPSLLYNGYWFFSGG